MRAWLAIALTFTLAAGLLAAQSIPERFAPRIDAVRAKAEAEGLDKTLVAYAVESERQRLLRIEDLETEVQRLRTHIHEQRQDREASAKIRAIERELVTLKRNQPHHTPRVLDTDRMRTPSTIGKIDRLQAGPHHRIDGVVQPRPERDVRLRVDRIMSNGDVLVSVIVLPAANATGRGATRERDEGRLLITGMDHSRIRVGQRVEPGEMVLRIGARGRLETERTELPYFAAEVIEVDRHRRTLDRVLQP